ncbi:MAG: hypothetical protein G01um101418_898 [Parcubacteria group bacterium Gr01-1014_18]|nr:MAG: hypothetical protein Greene041636_937 [Parcubacteria group bacterium Greene0416_36]TSC79794.1 MAG: hypothetical protein G01um101418_898 [Parcubacteria group bacterium Gr01-1014_18]TSC98078.1 MAG: hypothetical protein Greene101420_907 [Parcubacteria group bacterium Greene1014_20]TSD06513.1 MAG: hypothetical protein Greene07142_856 [Parcubacteria group bacterium Greene0714_2]
MKYFLFHILICLPILFCQENEKVWPPQEESEKILDELLNEGECRKPVHEEIIEPAKRKISIKKYSTAEGEFIYIESPGKFATSINDTEADLGTDPQQIYHTLILPSGKLFLEYPHTKRILYDIVSTAGKIMIIFNNEIDYYQKGELRAGYILPFAYTIEWEFDNYPPKYYGVHQGENQFKGVIFFHPELDMWEYVEYIGPPIEGFEDMDSDISQDLFFLYVRFEPLSLPGVLLFDGRTKQFTIRTK